MAAPRGPSHAQLHARGGLLAAEAPRGRDRPASVPRARRRHRDRRVPHGLRHVGRVLPEGGGDPRGGRAGRPGIPRGSPPNWKRLHTNSVQERTNREIKRSSRVVQAFPSTASLMRLVGADICEQDEMCQESRYFSEAKMGELFDEGPTRGIDGTVDWRGWRRRPEDDRIGHRACGQDRGGIGYQSCSRFQDAGPTCF